MKLKSLLLGSVAAAGLSTSAFAADLSVLTSLDVCDALGISGLTISSDTNCLQITGEVSSEFNWGDYNGSALGAGNINTLGGMFKVDDNDSVLVGGVVRDQDWNSEIDAWLKFVGTADSDFGPASATIKFDYDHNNTVINEGYPVAVPAVNTTSSNVLRVEEAFVSIGDSTVIMIGQKGSIFKNGDDEPLTVWKPFNSEKVDNGVETAFTDVADGGPSHVIQVVSDLGNGVSVGVALENLNGVNNWAAPVVPNVAPNTADDGTFVGYVAYAGDGIAAHLSVIGGGFADGTVEHWGVHGGFTGTFDNFTLVGAFAADDIGEWNALFSASATFDIFTLAAAVEATSGLRGLPATGDQWGFAASGSAMVTDGVTLNLGFRWFDQDSTVGATETWHIAGSLVAAVTETVTITGELGLYNTNLAAAVATNVTYGSAELAWAPGGDAFTSSVKGEINSAGAYKFTVKGKKTFQ